MAQDFSSLVERKLLVVTGKGGSGKSVLSLAIAHRLSKHGKRVWLVELGRKRDQLFSRLPELLEIAKAPHEPLRALVPGTAESISVSALDPARSLSEYVDLKLPTGGLAGVLLNNQVTASFLEVVPGLPDLVQLGKLWHAVSSAGAPFDCIVLDAPATGHAVAMLKAPGNFRRITKVGPVYRDAAAMSEFFSDAEKTGVVLTALPEEMAVQETLELRRLLGKDFPPPLLFVNKCFPSLPPHRAENPESPLWRAYRYARGRQKREQEAIAELKNAIPLPFLFPEPGAPPLAARLSSCLAEQLP